MSRDKASFNFGNLTLADWISGTLFYKRQPITATELLLQAG
jgi:hypothetical protein